MRSSITPQDDYEKVVDVWADNLELELSNIDRAIKEGFNHVAIDTEYPGVLYKQRYEDRSAAAIYAIMKSNVDKLKPIQIGLSLASPLGARPFRPSTWQFNMKFSVASDTFEPKSMQLLEEANIPLDSLAQHGIALEDFREGFKRSLMHANPELTWLSFHGNYDFAYLFKTITGDQLPESVIGFNELRKGICPVVYDVKMLVQSNESIMGYSLSKLALLFGVPEFGTLHQAGTDAFITADLFFRVRYHLMGNKIKKFENKLFGLSKVFSIESAEYETKKQKKSLLERLRDTKTATPVKPEEPKGSNQTKVTLVYGLVKMPMFGVSSSYSQGQRKQILPQYRAKA